MRKHATAFALIIPVMVLAWCGVPAPSLADEPLAVLSKFVPTDGRIVDGFGWYGRDMNLYESEFPTTLPYSANLMWSFAGYETRGWGGFNNFLSKYSNKAAQLSLQFDDREEQITSGAHDVLLTEFGNKFLSINRPLYLRLGFEVNGGWNNYDVNHFIPAFRYIVDFWDNMGVTNVAYIWNVHIMDSPLDYMAWYPGDNYVHWWSHEVLGPASDPNWNHNAPAVVQSRAFCEDAVSRGLPVAIGEASAWFTGVGNGQQSWDDWFDGYFNHINNPAYGVKAYWHLPHDWTTIPSYETYEDARPSVDPVVKAYWQTEMNEAQYLHETTPLDLAIIGWPLESTPPGDVTNVEVNTAPGEVAISWDNPSDPDLKGIKVLRRTGAYPSGPRDSGAVQVHNGPVSETSFTDTGLSDGTKYYYAIFAYDPVRNYSSGAYVSATPGESRLRIRNLTGVTVALLDRDGNLRLAGSLTEYSSPRATSGSELLVKNAGGAVVAAVYEDGDLVLAGSAHGHESSLTPPPTSFVVKNGAGDIVAYIDSSGDLYLTGEVLESSL